MIKPNSPKVNLRYAFVTFRPHGGNPLLLKQFTQIITCKIKANCDTYAIATEEAGTPAEHTHFFIKMPSSATQDKKKIIQWIMSKQMTEFKDSIKDSHTHWDVACDVLLVKQTAEDESYLLGYTLKSEKQKDIATQEIVGITKKYAADSIDLYYLSDSVQRKAQRKKNDTVLLTKKNAHRIIKDYLELKKLDVRDLDLKIKMRCDSYSFCDLTSRAEKEILDDVLLQSGKYSDSEYKILQQESNYKISDGCLTGQEFGDEVNGYCDQLKECIEVMSKLLTPEQRETFKSKYDLTNIISKDKTWKYLQYEIVPPTVLDLECHKLFKH